MHSQDQDLYSVQPIPFSLVTYLIPKTGRVYFSQHSFWSLNIFFFVLKKKHDLQRYYNHNYTVTYTHFSFLSAESLLKF